MCLAAFVAVTFWGVAQVATAESGNFHHIHLNVVNPKATIAFYKKFFSGVPTKFRGKADAILTDRSFILLNKVETAPLWKMETGLYHVGWGGVDGPSDFKWRDKEGVKWETPLSWLGTNSYMYAYGPDNEVIEIWTGFKHHRFGHIHLFADDVNASTKWYVDNINLKAPASYSPKPKPAPKDFEPDPDKPFALFQYLWTSQVSTDNGVAINVFSKPSNDTINWWAYDALGDLKPTDGRVIDHIAFSFEEIQPVFDRMKKNGVEIVDPIKMRPEFAMKSFFVRGPDKVLIEIVEASPFLGGDSE